MGFPSYEQIVLGMAPVFYVPGKSATATEMVLGTKGAVTGTVSPGPMPFTNSSVPGLDTRPASNSRLGFATNAAYHPGDTFTLMAWFNQTTAGDAAPALMHWGTGDFTFYFMDDKLALRKAGTADIVTTTQTFAAPMGRWVHAVCTKNAGTSAAIYINGVDDSTGYANQTIVASTDAPTLANQSGATANDFRGYIAHAAVWNRVLTAGEIRELYTAGERR